MSNLFNRIGNLPLIRNRKESIKKRYFDILNSLHRPFLLPGAQDPSHAVFQEYIALSTKAESPVMLEIGSRNVSELTRSELFPNCKEYVGLDILEGDGVDIVGDVHKLSNIFPSEHFDFVFSVSVFEHLLFPWKAVLELNKVMKVGGHVYLSTHPTWPTHELPWDFWRFPQNGFHALFNKFTGFEIVALSEGLPCNVYSLVDDPPTREAYKFPSNQAVALIAKKQANYRSDLLKWDIDIADVVDTMYPNRT